MGMMPCLYVRKKKYWQNIIKWARKFVFSAEINCWTDKRLAAKYPETKSPSKCLCSGGFIGKAGYIKKKIEEKLGTESIQKDPFSNQTRYIGANNF